MLLLLGILAVALVGICVAAPESPEKLVFKKGCIVIVKECTNTYKISSFHNQYQSKIDEM